MKRVIFAFAALILGGSLSAFAQECPFPSQAVATMHPVDRSETWKARRESIQSDLALHSYDVITLGDSIMHLWSTERLTSIFGTTVLNSGFGSDRIQDVLWRLQTTDWHGQSPHYVLLLVGTNDIFWGSTACEVYWGIRATISKIQNVFPKARVVVTSILPRGQNTMWKDAEIRETNTELKTASTNANYEFFDPHDAFLCDHHTPCSLLQPDLDLHPSAKGYDLLDDLLKQFIKQDAQRQRTPSA